MLSASPAATCHARWKTLPRAVRVLNESRAAVKPLATRHIRVAQSLGVGLDEKAIEAIRPWKFEPSRKDGVPVAVLVDIEVNFHLY